MDVFAVALPLLLWAATPTGQAAEERGPSSPGVVRAVAPNYPELPTLVVGYVLVDATVDASGAVTDARVVRTPAMLQKEPVQAARLWRFEPAAGSSPRTVRLMFIFDQLRDPSIEELYPVFVPPYAIEIRAKCRRHCDGLDTVSEGVFPPRYERPKSRAVKP